MYLIALYLYSTTRHSCSRDFASLCPPLVTLVKLRYNVVNFASPQNSESLPQPVTPFALECDGFLPAEPLCKKGVFFETAACYQLPYCNHVFHILEQSNLKVCKNLAVNETEVNNATGNYIRTITLVLSTVAFSLSF